MCNASDVSPRVRKINRDDDDEVMCGISFQAIGNGSPWDLAAESWCFPVVLFPCIVIVISSNLQEEEIRKKIEVQKEKQKMKSKKNNDDLVKGTDS